MDEAPDAARLHHAHSTHRHGRGPTMIAYFMLLVWWGFVALIYLSSRLFDGL